MPRSGRSSLSSPVCIAAKVGFALSLDLPEDIGSAATELRAAELRAGEQDAGEARGWPELATLVELARQVAPYPSVPSLTARMKAAQVSAANVRTGEPDPSLLSLIVTELASNAIVHAGGPGVRAWLMTDQARLLIMVGDSSPSMPEQAAVPDHAKVRGRGLVIVDALASSWGAYPTPAGKIVFALLAI